MCPSSGGQPPIKGNKKKVQVRNRFEALQTDAEEILTNDETVDPIWPEAITKKQDQNRRNQTHKRRVVSSKLNTRGNGKELIASHRAKERTARDGITATKAKD